MKTGVSFLDLGMVMCVCHTGCITGCGHIKKRRQPERQFTGCRRKKVIIELYLHVRIEIHSPHIVALTFIRAA